MCLRQRAELSQSAPRSFPAVRNWAKPPSPFGIPSAAYRACTSPRETSTSRWRTCSTPRFDATARTASLTSRSAGLNPSGISFQSVRDAGNRTRPLIGSGPGLLCGSLSSPTSTATGTRSKPFSRIPARGVDEIWCLGDIVGYGPQPNRCVTEARARRRSACSGTTISPRSAGRPVGLLARRRGERALDDRASSSRTLAGIWRRSSRRASATASSSSTRARATRSGSTCSASRLYAPRSSMTRPRSCSSATATSRSPCCSRTATPRGRTREGRQRDRADRGPLAAQSRLGRPAARRRRSGGLPADRPRDRNAHFRRVPYDIESTQAEIRKAGLPEALAERLASASSTTQQRAHAEHSREARAGAATTAWPPTAWSTRRSTAAATAGCSSDLPPFSADEGFLHMIGSAGGACDATRRRGRGGDDAHGRGRLAVLRPVRRTRHHRRPLAARVAYRGRRSSGTSARRA